MDDRPRAQSAKPEGEAGEYEQAPGREPQAPKEQTVVFVEGEGLARAVSFSQPSTPLNSAGSGTRRTSWDPEDDPPGGFAESAEWPGQAEGTGEEPSRKLAISINGATLLQRRKKVGFKDQLSEHDQASLLAEGMGGRRRKSSVLEHLESFGPPFSACKYVPTKEAAGRPLPEDKPSPWPGGQADIDDAQQGTEDADGGEMVPVLSESNLLLRASVSFGVVPYTPDMLPQMKAKSGSLEQVEDKHSDWPGGQDEPEDVWQEGSNAEKGKPAAAGSKSNLLAPPQHGFFKLAMPSSPKERTAAEVRAEEEGEEVAGWPSTQPKAAAEQQQPSCLDAAEGETAAEAAASDGCSAISRAQDSFGPPWTEAIMSEGAEKEASRHEVESPTFPGSPNDFSSEQLPFSDSDDDQPAVERKRMRKLQHQNSFGPALPAVTAAGDKVVKRLTFEHVDETTEWPTGDVHGTEQQEAPPWSNGQVAPVGEEQQIPADGEVVLTPSGEGMTAKGTPSNASSSPDYHGRLLRTASTPFACSLTGEVWEREEQAKLAERPTGDGEPAAEHPDGTAGVGHGDTAKLAERPIRDGEPAAEHPDGSAGVGHGDTASAAQSRPADPPARQTTKEGTATSTKEDQQCEGREHHKAEFSEGAFVAGIDKELRNQLQPAKPAVHPHTAKSQRQGTDEESQRCEQWTATWQAFLDKAARELHLPSLPSAWQHDGQANDINDLQAELLQMMQEPHRKVIEGLQKHSAGTSYMGAHPSTLVNPEAFHNVASCRGSQADSDARLLWSELQQLTAVMQDSNIRAEQREQALAEELHEAQRACDWYRSEYQSLSRHLAPVATAEALPRREACGADLLRQQLAHRNMVVSGHPDRVREQERDAVAAERKAWEGDIASLRAELRRLTEAQAAGALATEAREAETQALQADITRRHGKLLAELEACTSEVHELKAQQQIEPQRSARRAGQPEADRKALEQAHALAAYEMHFNLPKGSATIPQVASSSAGVAGWYTYAVCVGLTAPVPEAQVSDLNDTPRQEELLAALEAATSEVYELRAAQQIEARRSLRRARQWEAERRELKEEIQQLKGLAGRAVHGCSNGGAQVRPSSCGSATRAKPERRREAACQREARCAEKCPPRGHSPNLVLGIGLHPRRSDRLCPAGDVHRSRDSMESVQQPEPEEGGTTAFFHAKTAELKSMHPTRPAPAPSSATSLERPDSVEAAENPHNEVRLPRPRSAAEQTGSDSRPSVRLRASEPALLRALAGKSQQEAAELARSYQVDREVESELSTVDTSVGTPHHSRMRALLRDALVAGRAQKIQPSAKAQDVQQSQDGRVPRTQSAGRLRRT